MQRLVNPFKISYSNPNFTMSITISYTHALRTLVLNCSSYLHPVPFSQYFIDFVILDLSARVYNAY